MYSKLKKGTFVSGYGQELIHILEYLFQNLLDWYTKVALRLNLVDHPVDILL